MQPEFRTETGLCWITDTMGGKSSFPNPSYTKSLQIDIASTSGKRDEDHPFGWILDETFHPRGRFVHRTLDQFGVRRDSWGEGFISGGGVSDVYMLPEPDPQGLIFRADAKFYDAIRESEVSINTTVGEGRETYRLMRDVAASARSLLTALKSARKGNLKPLAAMANKVRVATKNPIQSLGSITLLVNLAVKPLIMDINALRNHALSGKADSLSFVVKVRSGERLSMAKSYSLDGYPGLVVKEALNGGRRVETRALLRVTDLHQFENWRAGLVVRPTLIWELLPLSFLVDYFLSIGNYLEQWEASVLNNGFSLISGYRTYSKKLEWIKEYDGRNSTPISLGWQWEETQANQRKTHRQLHRVLLTALPIPVLPVVKLPSGDSTSGATQLINCAALISQLLTRNTK